MIILLLVTTVSLIYAEEGQIETPRVAESTSESEESNPESQENSSSEQGSNKANDNIYDVGSDSDIVPVEDIELEKYKKTLYVGETLSLLLTFCRQAQQNKGYHTNPPMWQLPQCLPPGR